MAGVTFVDIANSALVKLGAEPIMSFDDDSKEARTTKNRYKLVRDIVLRMHPWNCATERVVTAPLTSTPAFGFTYEHQLPADCLRVLSIDPEDDTPYRIEGKRIRTDSTAINLKYIKRIEDPSELDELLAESIAAYLAWDISYTITQSNTVQDKMAKKLKTILAKAKSTDAQEDPSPELEANLWVESRLVFTGRPLRRDR